MLQGNTWQELQRWYKSVSTYQFDGWAFGGALRDDLYWVIRMLLDMRRRGTLGDRLHFLGIGRLDLACLLTSLQTALRTINPKMMVSFDCATPFLVGGKYKKGIVGAKLAQDGFSLQLRDLPASHQYVGDMRAFPYSSPIGNRITMGDICPRQQIGSSRWDMISYFIVATITCTPMPEP